MAYIPCYKTFLSDGSIKEKQRINMKKLSNYTMALSLAKIGIRFNPDEDYFNIGLTDGKLDAKNVAYCKKIHSTYFDKIDTIKKCYRDSYTLGYKHGFEKGKEMAYKSGYINCIHLSDDERTMLIEFLVSNHIILSYDAMKGGFLAVKDNF